MKFEVKLTKKVFNKLIKGYKKPLDIVEVEETLLLILDTLSNNPYSYPQIDEFRIVTEPMLPIKLIYYIEKTNVILFDTLDWEDYG